MEKQYFKNINKCKIGPIQISLAILFLIGIMEITSQTSYPAYSFIKKLNHAIAGAGAYICENEVARCLMAAPVIKVENAQIPAVHSAAGTNNSVEKGKTDSANKASNLQDASNAGKQQAENKPQTPFQPIIHKAAKQYEVEPAIIKAIIMAESSFNPKAVSHKGAQGLMQLMPKTAKYLGVIDSFNPEHNIDGGVRYFKKLLDRFDGDVKLALAAYNAGSRNVLRYKGVPPFKATKVYIEKVLQYYETYKAV